MIVAENPKRLSKQKCPLCGEDQDVILNGFFKNADGESELDPNRGYAFCNCRNIFFTPWSNMKAVVYDAEYHEKYLGPEAGIALSNYASKYAPIFEEHFGKGLIVELGAVSPATLDGFKDRGFECVGMDIFKHPFGNHRLIVGNIEGTDLPDCDFIWASHIFEHFRDPIRMVRRCYDALSLCGLMFVAMPDPYAVDWKCPNVFAHWNLDEHHIIWDMASFCEVLEENGFQVILANRNYEANFIGTSDYHILAKKRGA